MRIIFREGRCKGIGIITKVHCEEEDVNKPAQTVSLTESGGVAKPEGGSNGTTRVDAEEVAPEVEVHGDEEKGRKKEEKDRKKAAASKGPQQNTKKK